MPHGHNNMATAFLILGGKFHGRHYDRLEDEEKHLIIEPTIDTRWVLLVLSCLAGLAGARVAGAQPRQVSDMRAPPPGVVTIIRTGGPPAAS